jgi:hypothetical protein
MPGNISGARTSERIRAGITKMCHILFITALEAIKDFPFNK